MVTASIPIVIRNGSNKMGVRAVAGIQLKYENFAQLFLESFGTCDNYPCQNLLTCNNDVRLLIFSPQNANHDRSRRHSLILFHCFFFQ